ncbi:MAG: hypothetical protein LBD68_01560 [Zoogloeaceae bacterium]|nr:hypothetical protein [Zoogloeaceae bacterium]
MPEKGSKTVEVQGAPTEDVILEEVCDLDAAALSVLENDLQQQNNALPWDSDLRFPDLLVEGASARFVKTIAASHAPPGATPVHSGGLLGQLCEMAQDVLAQQENRAHQDAQLAIQVDRALRYVFAWLHGMTQQLNILKPEMSCAYPLSGDKCLDALIWQQGYVDYRTASSSEQALVHSVTMRYRMMGEKPPVVLEYRDQAAEDFRQRLFDFNLNAQVREVRDERYALQIMRFIIAQEVRVNIHWEPDYQEGVLVIRVFNLERLGRNTYRLPIDAPLEALLDEFGRMILGAPNHFLHLVRSLAS